MFLEQKANFAVKKRFWPIFYRIFESDKPRATNCKGPKRKPAFTVEVIRSFFLNLRGR